VAAAFAAEMVERSPGDDDLAVTRRFVENR